MRQTILLFLLTTSLITFSQSRSALNPALAPFYHGVASGDPTANSVIIWTRVTITVPQALVRWQVATDTAMRNIVQRGTVLTDASRDFTVKADVTGLQSDQFYYYEFEFQNKLSLTGRTKTAPSSATANVRFAVVSCSNYAEGYFNAYKAVRDRNDVDAVIHLGDYIYEYGNGQYGNMFNLQPATEIITLSDYRTRYNYYHLDTNLIRVHQQYAFLNIWDDHEFADNAYTNGAANHTEGVEGTWVNRKAAAIRAYREWLPVRDQSPTSDVIYRSVRYGNLAEIFLLDTRIIDRDKQYTVNLPEFLQDPGRNLIGATQRNWLSSSITNSTSQWKVIGQQVMMAPLRVLGVPVNMDQWDGYAGERNRVYNIIRNKSNVVVLSADLHCSVASELPDKNYKPGAATSPCQNSAGVEFVTTSISARSKEFLNGIAQPAIYAADPHIKYAELAHHGYGIIDFKSDKAQYEWYFVSTINSPVFTTTLAKSYYVYNNTKCLNETTVATVAAAGKKGLQAPQVPRRNGTSARSSEELITSGSVVNTPKDYTHYWYPNPTQGDARLEVNSKQATVAVLNVFDASGKIVLSQNLNLETGVNNFIVRSTTLIKGAYMYNITIKDEKVILQGAFIKL